MRRMFSEDLAVHAKRERVAEMYLRGLTQAAIAEKENTTQATISRDLAAIKKAWQQSAIRHFDEDVNKELDRIDLLERTYWEGWQRSCREGRDGNPSWLAGVERCVERRCKLLGLDAPEKRRYEHTGEGGGPIGHSHDHKHSLDPTALRAFRDDLARAGLVGVPGHGGQQPLDPKAPDPPA
jgi:hypothetical protein